MLLEVRHITEYRYDRSVRESIIELRMQPRRTSGQTLVSFELDVEPHAQILSYADTWGNAVHHFDTPICTINSTSPPDRWSKHMNAWSCLETLSLDEWTALASDTVRGESWDFLTMHGFVEETPTLQAFVEAQGLMGLERSRSPVGAS